MSVYIVYILVMLACGSLGGVANFLINQDKGSRRQFLSSLVLGIVAALLVPLFLKVISSNLLKFDELDPGNMLVFAGFCLIAAISSRKFISTLSDKVLAEAREAKEAAKDAEASYEKVERQNSTDAKAYSILGEWLEGQDDRDAAPISASNLQSLISVASSTVKARAFAEARQYRKESRDDFRSDKVIPIFEALIESDKDGKYHRNHAQLAYALIERHPQDWGRAFAELSKAIEIRDKMKVEGYLIYEFMSAICSINSDPDFALGKKSAIERTEKIVRHLAKASNLSYWKKVIAGQLNPDRNQELLDWLKLNEVKDLRID